MFFTTANNNFTYAIANTLSYRELQKKLKAMKANGVKVRVRLNDKLPALRKEYIRILEAIAAGTRIIIKNSTAIASLQLAEEGLNVQWHSSSKVYTFNWGLMAMLGALEAESVGRAIAELKAKSKATRNWSTAA